MLPLIVISAAVLFFLLNRSGFFERLQTRERTPRQNLGERVLEELKRDPELNQRLEVFKDFLEEQQDEEE